MEPARPGGQGAADGPAGGGGGAGRAGPFPGADRRAIRRRGARHRRGRGGPDDPHRQQENRHHALFALALGAGMRQGELLALQWGDIDFEKGSVEVKRSLSQVGKEFIVKEPKSKAGRRSVLLPPFVVSALRDHRAAALKAVQIACPVFCTRTGTFTSKNNFVRQVFRPLVKKANAAARTEAAGRGTEPDLIPEDIRFHDLRHTHASHLIAAGHSIKAVSRRLGHADITITLKVYAHLMPNDDEKLAAGVEALYG
ncbi:MAG: site-specific integrase [Gemmataceae bacterium]|nr:site-specific integrase [Gemmataceae bacterium]